MGRRTGVLGVALAAATLGIWGCGGGGGEKPAVGPGSSNGAATVSGKISLNGKAVSKGSVTFEPLGTNGIPTGSNVAKVDKDGAYSVTTVSGSHDVTISGTGTTADASYNKTTIDVKPGSNTKDFNLPLAQ